MLLESERLGPIEVAESSMINMPEGLLGFESLHRYAVLSADEEGAYAWFHSLEDPGLAFLAAIPSFFFPDYAPEIPQDDVDALEISGPEDVQLLCLITIEGDNITANLMGPVVLNVHTRQARQVVLVDQGVTTKEPLLGG